MQRTDTRIRPRPESRILALALLSALVAAAPGRAEAQTKAYVASANAVTVIDTATEAVLTTVAVDAGPGRVAISRDGARAYMSNRTSGTISVIDTATDTVAAIIPVGDSPTSLAVTPDGRQVYVMVTGAIEVIDTAQNVVTATIPLETSGGGVSITPDGRHAYVASGAISVIDTATRTIVHAFFADSGSASDVAISPDGSRAYVTTNGTDAFAAGAGVAVVDTSTQTVTGTVELGVIPGPIALSPDGSRVYVGVRAVFVNTGYGSAFIPGSSVAVIDTLTAATIAWINLGSGGAAWFLQNTAEGIAVTPDRSDVYVSIPRINSVAVIGTSANVVRQLVPVTSPSGLAIVPDSSAVVTPYVIDAVDDVAPFSIPFTGATAVANVLANDTLGGVPATLAHVALSQQSSTDARISLDSATGAVNVAAGAALGTHSLVYRICEIASPLNCDEATVAVTVREPYVIDAVDDAATARPGTVAITSVLVNDRLGSAAATAATVRVSLVSSTHPGLTINPANGAVSVAPGTPLGPQSLVYRICEIADPANCDQATAAVTVVPTPLDAVDDIGVSTRSGGVAQGNVLFNDKLNGTPATLARVTLEFVSSTHTGVRLALTSGAVTVTAGTPVGVYSLVYRICERANLANCDQAVVTVTVNPYVINAVNDSARASSKVAGIALASVLANDFLGNVRATPANVRLSFVSLTPANSKIKLDLSDGSVDVLGKTESGRYLLVYEICELENPTNCDRATVNLDLSGGG